MTAQKQTRRDLLKTAAVAACGFASGNTSVTEAFAQTTTSSMLMRKIPSTGESIPAVGLGTWQTFDPPTLDDANLHPLEQVLQTYYDLGGRVVDTSPMYRKAERVTGDLSTKLKINDKLFLATKIWTPGKDAGAKQLQVSFAKLGRLGQKLDLVAVHNLVDWQTQLDTLREWKQKGQVRYIGVTHSQTSAFGDLEQIMSTQKLDFVQLNYSLATRAAEKQLLPLAKDKGIATMINRPFEEGSLFSKVKGKELPELARGFASSWSEAFLKFILANDAVTCVIPATNKLEHLRENMNAGMGRLPTEDERKQLVASIS
jgi:aryl-alcohol dehydrogenase-like predicted oxidoreductase